MICDECKNKGKWVFDLEDLRLYGKDMHESCYLDFRQVLINKPTFMYGKDFENSDWWGEEI